LTKQELSDLLGITRPTLNNWEKKKPELVRLINQGLMMDKQIEDMETSLNKLKELKAKSSNGKFNLK
jgi:transcriptional regulator with XRE-family HTH domain